MNTLIAAISGDQLVHALIWIVVAALIFWILTWALGQIGLPEPFNKIVRVVLVVAVAIVAINALLGLAGHGFIDF